MRDRLGTAAGAALALLVVFVLLFQQPQESSVTRPLSTESGRNGYLALSHWLRDSGVPVFSLRERYTRLLNADVRFPPRGNVMISTMPHASPVRLEERRAIRGWIGAGNTLLIMAALDDTPEWLPLNDLSVFLGQLEALSGLVFRSLGEQAGDDPPPRAAQPVTTTAGQSELELLPLGDHPLMADIEVLRGLSDADSAPWSAAADDGVGPLLALAAERASGTDAIWQVPHFNGQVIVVASGSLLSNHLVAESGGARFVANVLRHHLRSGGSVIFDDMHQGLSALYDPAAFYGDPRLHASLGFLLAAWLVYVLGASNRLAPPAAERSEPRQSEFLAASGGFLARRLGRRDAALLLFEEWFEEIRRRQGIGRGAEPPWTLLRSMPALDDDVYRELHGLYARLDRGRPVDLIRLHNTLRRARQAIG